MRTVTIGQFEQGPVAELRLIAKVGERIFVAALVLKQGSMRQKQARLSDKIERHIGERNVLFEHRAMAAPLGQTLTEHQCAVGQT